METTTSYLITQGLFLKAVAFIYLIAFASLALQVKGLYGEKGSIPNQFNDLKAKAKTGQWWSRELLGNYTLVYSLRSNS